ncbi:MAG: hypothetical protein ACOC2W_01195, partial [bacterium]
MFVLTDMPELARFTDPFISGTVVVDVCVYPDALPLKLLPIPPDPEYCPTADDLAPSRLEWVET